MKVFLTGGTGFVGRHLAARLIADGRRVTCLARRPDGAAAGRLVELGAEVVGGDVTDVDALTRAAAGADAFIHLVGIIFEHRQATFKAIHLEGTRNALAAAAACGCSRFVHMSALGTEPEAAGGYFRSKWAAEEAVRESGLPFTIFRPSIIYGDGGEFIHMLASQVRLLPFVPVIGKGRYLMQPIAVSDVAACFSRCLDIEAAAGRTYQIAGPEQLSYDQMIDTLAWVLDRGGFKLHIPVFLMRPVAWLSQRLQKKPMLTTDQLNMLLKDNICDITAMRQELGVEPREFAAGLREMFEA